MLLENFIILRILEEKIANISELDFISLVYVIKDLYDQSSNFNFVIVVSKDFTTVLASKFNNLQEFCDEYFDKELQEKYKLLLI